MSDKNGSSGKPDVDAIREDQEYGGMRVKLMAILGNVRIPSQVDVGAGDAVVPAPDDLQTDRQAIGGESGRCAERGQSRLRGQGTGGAGLRVADEGGLPAHRRIEKCIEAKAVEHANHPIANDAALRQRRFPGGGRAGPPGDPDALYFLRALTLDRARP